MLDFSHPDIELSVRVRQESDEIRIDLTADTLIFVVNDAVFTHNNFSR